MAKAKIEAIMNPLVTIITPTYNRAGDYLAETIESVLAQTYQNFEYLILDDGSTDNTRELVASYDDPRIEYLFHENIGVVRTVNKGFELAQGEFVTVVNSDDPLLPNYLEEAVPFLQAHPEIMGVYPDWVMVDNQSQPIEYVQTMEYDFAHALGGYKCYPGPGTLLRTLVFKLVGLYNHEYKSIFDFEFYLRIGFAGEKLCRLPKTLASYRHHSQTISSNYMTSEYLKLVEEVYDSDKLTSEFHHLKRRSYGSVYYLTALTQLADRRRATLHFLQSLFLCPIGCYPEGKPRNRQLMWEIMTSAILPTFLRRPLGKIKMRLRYKNNELKV